MTLINSPKKYIRLPDVLRLPYDWLVVHIFRVTSDFMLGLEPVHEWVNHVTTARTTNVPIDSCRELVLTALTSYQGWFPGSPALSLLGRIREKALTLVLCESPVDNGCLALWADESPTAAMVFDFLELTITVLVMSL